jgi:hypothetical protein
MMLARGHASEVKVYQVRLGSDEWLALAPVVAKVQLPELASRSRAKRVPPRLLHLFWNTAPAQLDIASSAPYIARRLLTAFDPDGLAWGAVNLPASAWEHAAATRGVEPAKRALARNLARYAHAAWTHPQHPAAATRVQFLHADETRPQRLLESPTPIAGLHVARISDLMAMKLKVVGDRGELRDYFDLMTIEQQTGRLVDEGLALFLERFQPEYPDQAINHILLGLGYFDDV